MKKPLTISLFVVGSLLILGLVGWFAQPAPVTRNRREESQKKDSAQVAVTKPNAKRDLVLEKVSWQKGGDGSEGFHSFSVYNASKTYNYPTVTVRFSYYSDLGDEVGHVDRVIDKAVNVGETVHIDKLETGILNEHADGADMEVL